MSKQYLSVYSKEEFGLDLPEVTESNEVHSFGTLAYGDTVSKLMYISRLTNTLNFTLRRGKCYCDKQLACVKNIRLAAVGDSTCIYCKPFVADRYAHPFGIANTKNVHYFKDYINSQLASLDVKDTDVYDEAELLEDHFDELVKGSLNGDMVAANTSENFENYKKLLSLGMIVPLREFLSEDFSDSIFVSSEQLLGYNGLHFKGRLLHDLTLTLFNDHDWIAFNVVNELVTEAAEKIFVSFHPASSDIAPLLDNVAKLKDVAVHRVNVNFGNNTFYHFIAIYSLAETGITTNSVAELANFQFATSNELKHSCVYVFTRGMCAIVRRNCQTKQYTVIDFSPISKIVDNTEFGLQYAGSYSLLRECDSVVLNVDSCYCDDYSDCLDPIEFDDNIYDDKHHEGGVVFSIKNRELSEKIVLANCKQNNVYEDPLPYITSIDLQKRLHIESGKPTGLLRGVKDDVICQFCKPELVLRQHFPGPEKGLYLATKLVQYYDDIHMLKDLVHESVVALFRIEKQVSFGFNAILQGIFNMRARGKQFIAYVGLLHDPKFEVIRRALMGTDNPHIQSCHHIYLDGKKIFTFEVILAELVNPIVQHFDICFKVFNSSVTIDSSFDNPNITPGFSVNKIISIDSEDDATHDSNELAYIFGCEKVKV